ncbi:MAG TPA: hypothetical protein VHO70_06240 [Chitinispirillaceae bacterium]|nr:hypothetical protein [Chitinispirillaceae bacterium]
MSTKCNHLRTGLFLFCSVLVVCSCGPSLYVQNFSMSTIAEHNRVHIESGRKQTYGELGVSYFNTLKSNKSQFVMERSYDFEKRDENLKTLNTHVNSPGEVFGIYGAILGRLYLRSGCWICGWGS